MSERTGTPRARVRGGERVLRRRPFAARAGLYLLLWAITALFFGSQYWLLSQYAGRNDGFLKSLRYPLIDAAIWAALGLAAIALARRFPLERGRVLRGLAVHLPAAVLMSFAEGACAFAALHSLHLFGPSSMPAREVLGRLMIGKFHTNVLTYAALVGLVHLRDYYGKYRERELRSSRLEARLAQAELEVLKMQLHPHFLFNTLHAISALMHRDVEAADRMLSRLGDLLRLALEDVGAQEVSLQHELDFVGRYLEIEQIRFGERIRIEVAVAPETLDALVPSLVLQPLVENAIRHGIAPRAGGGRLEIRALREGAMLRLQVCDDGPGLPADGVPRSGVGLANTRARCEQLYGSDHRFELANRPEGGLAITLAIPFRTGESGARP